MPYLSTFNYFLSLYLQKGQVFPPFIWFHAHVFHRPRLLFFAEIAIESVHFESFPHILIKLQNFELGYEVRHVQLKRIKCRHFLVRYLFWFVRLSTSAIPRHLPDVASFGAILLD